MAATVVKSNGTQKLVIERIAAPKSLLLTMCVFISNPMWKMMKNKAIEETAFMSLVKKTKPSNVGPIIIPLNNSPATEGRPSCSNSSPTKMAAARTTRASVIISNMFSPQEEVP